MMADRYTVKGPTDSANIPGWLIINNKLKLSYTARLLAQAILFHVQRGDDPPTRDDLAADFEVDTRTIDRWLDELRAAKILQTHRGGRRHSFAVHKPKTRRESTAGSTLIDLSTVNRSINVDPSVYNDSCPQHQKASKRPRVDRSVYNDMHPTHQKASKRPRVDRSINNPHVGVGGDHDSLKEDPPTPTCEPLKTELGRYMARKRYMAAPQFDSADLDYAAHIRAIEEMERQGLTKSQIVYFLKLDPPTSATYPPLPSVTPSPPADTGDLDGAGDLTSTQEPAAAAVSPADLVRFGIVSRLGRPYQALVGRLTIEPGGDEICLSCRRTDLSQVLASIRPIMGAVLADPGLEQFSRVLVK